MTPTVRAPWMSETQVWLVRACCTVRNFLFLCRITAKSRGARSLMQCSWSHLSVQNKVFSPLHWTKLLNLNRYMYRQCRPRAVWLLFSAKIFEIGNAQTTRFSWRASRLPCHETVPSTCFLVPSPQIASSDFVNHFNGPLRQINGHHKINEHCSKNKLHMDLPPSSCQQVCFPSWQLISYKVNDDLNMLFCESSQWEG